MDKKNRKEEFTSHRRHKPHTSASRNPCLKTVVVVVAVAVVAVVVVVVLCFGPLLFISLRSEVQTCDTLNCVQIERERERERDKGGREGEGEREKER